MPGYVGKYVGMADAIEEIARVHFDGNIAEADANLSRALQDKALSALSNEPSFGVPSIEEHPLFFVSAQHWQGSRQIWNDTSWRRNCLLRRKDLLKIYSGLWETEEPGQGENATPEPEPEAVIENSGERSEDSIELFRTGAPGRPTAKDKVVEEHQRRTRANEAEKILAAEARYLWKWLPGAYPKAPKMTAKSVENIIRSKHNAWKAGLSEKADQSE